MKKLELTNLEKIFWPKEKISKGDVIDYYNSMSRYILPYLKGRPQSLKRNPNGIADNGFFQKDTGEAAPDWVATQKIYSASTRQDVDYIICNNKPTLIYLAHLAQEKVPEISTLERSLKRRGKNKVYIDYLQNSHGQTLACAYSLRPRPGATVSTPLKWKEVKRGLRPDRFNIHSIPKRVAKTGDLFKDVLKKGINLENCIRELTKEHS